MKQFSGRVAVVTGAGSGIGRATAVELATRGCNVALVDVNGEGLAESQRLVEKEGVNASVHITDVSDPVRMSELPDEVVDIHGSVSILVNNAGVLSVGRFADDSLENLRWIISINLWGVVHGCHYFLPYLRDSDEAHIVNVSSMAGIIGIPQNAAYSLTKGGVRSFTEALRAELVGTHIGVSALFPGSTDTNITRGSRGAQSARLDALQDKKIVHWFSSSPQAAGRKIAGAIEHNKPRVLLGPDVRAMDVAARIVPGRSGLIGRVLNLIT